MSCYVDEAVWPFGRMIMCHLLADSLEELHAMAGQLGMKHRWFQNKPNGTPHYDICKSKRSVAIRLGAIPVDRHEMAGIMNYWRYKHLL